MSTRPIRNNNPGDLEYGPFAQKTGATGSDGRFAIYPDMATGCYALARLLLAYQDEHGIQTVRQIVNRFAPGTENNTAAYISFFDGVLGCGPDDRFDFRSADFLYWAVTAIGEEEAGHDEFTHNVTDADINGGVSRALGG